MNIDGVALTIRDREGADGVANSAMLQQAAEWFALLRSGAETERDRADWRAWLNANNAHREAWQLVDAVSRRFESFQSREEQQAAVSALQSTRGDQLTRRRALNLVLCAGASAFGWVTLRHSSSWQLLIGDLASACVADYRTATGEIRAMTLADGARAWLNTATALDVDYQSSLRRLRLYAGEVLIDTAHDAARPFVVDTDHGRLRALGTRFTVRSNEATTLLSVAAGAVEIRAAESGATRLVAAGRQLRFSGDGFTDEGPASAAAEGWINGMLLAEDIPLGELIAELMRYRHGYIHVAPAIASLRVLGGFPLRDPDKVLAMLEETLPIRVRRTLPWWVSIEAREVTS